MCCFTFDLSIILIDGPSITSYYGVITSAYGVMKAAMVEVL